MALIGLMMTGTQSVPLRCQVLSNNRCSAGPSAIGWEDLGGGPCLLLVNEPSSQQPRGASSCRSSPHILPGSCVAPLPPGPEPEGRVASQAHRLAQALVPGGGEGCLGCCPGGGCQVLFLRVATLNGKI